MNTFIESVKNELEKTTTENGANAYTTTKSPLVDLFGCIGSLRGRDEKEICEKFEDAFNEDPLLAMKMLFYARNIRGGLGERETFKTIVSYLAFNHEESLILNLINISFYGRWDDLYALVGTPLEEYVWDIFRLQLSLDIENFQKKQPISLLAKWLKSANTSSKESRILGNLTSKSLGITAKEYRITLSVLRNWIDVVESKMSAQEWVHIDFERVPSKAMLAYRKAFNKRTPELFQSYMEKVKSGEKKINAATLFPYDILESMGIGDGYTRGNFVSINDDEVAEAQWKALPNYVETPTNFLVMADTSGSMQGRPLATAVGLAVYFAERNHGEFENVFLTFSSHPKYVYLKGNTLADKIRKIEALVQNTDLEAAFELVLDTAINNKVAAEDMPKAIIVISDGEIDSFASYEGEWSFLSKITNLYNNAGYEIPKVVMWNVEARHDCYIDSIKNPNIQFISGSSPSVFRNLINSFNKNAYELMLDTLNDPIYDAVCI